MDSTPAPARCVACGNEAPRTDVVDLARGAALLLAECVRCAHRWTVRLGPVQAARSPEIAGVLHPQRPHSARPLQIGLTRAA